MQSTICLYCVWYECVAQCDAVGVWASWANVCVSEVFEIGGVGPLGELIGGGSRVALRLGSAHFICRIMFR